MIASTSKARLPLPPCTCQRPAPSSSSRRSLNTSSPKQKPDVGASYESSTASSSPLFAFGTSNRPRPPPPPAQSTSSSLDKFPQHSRPSFAANRKLPSSSQSSRWKPLAKSDFTQPVVTSPFHKPGFAAKKPIKRDWRGPPPAPPLRQPSAVDVAKRLGGIRRELEMRDDASYRRQEEAPTASVPQRRQREVEEVREEQIDVEEEIRAKYEGKKRTNETRTALDAVKARVIAVAKQAVIPSACEVDFLADALAATEEEIKAVMRRIDVTAPLAERRAMTPDEASLVAMELGFTPVIDRNAIEIVADPPHAQPHTLPLRPAICCVMGHVDHGKTTLLDTLRSASVAQSEAGGITQHIGAFEVPLNKLFTAASARPRTDQTITFLDTPGHAAFKAMRARGAGVTDVAVLVVAADDGVKPQTREVIELLKGTDVAIVVAVTKCDKPGVKTDIVEGELADAGITVESLGGDVPCVHVSAFTKQGMDDLVETITAIADVRDLRAERTGVRSEGRVIEAHVKNGKGNVATIVITRGTLKTGQVIIAGEAYCKIRRLVSPTGAVLREAHPGQPVEIDGWKTLPNAGDRTLEARDETEAVKAAATRRARSERVRELAEVAEMNANATQRAEQLNKYRADAIAASGRENRSADTLNLRKQARAMASDEARHCEFEFDETEVRLVVKADFDGTLEAVVGALETLKDHRARTRIITQAVGDVSPADVLLAHSQKALIVAFNVRTERAAESLRNDKYKGEVDILSSKVIYSLIGDVTAKVEAAMPPITEFRPLGQATVAQRFSIPVAKGKLAKGRSQGIAGCRVVTGTIVRQANVRVVRDGIELWKGKLEALKQHKEDKESVGKGQECGLAFDGWDGFDVGDVVEASEEVEIKQRLGV